MLRTLALLLGLTSLAACSDDGHALIVDVRTDYAPGVEFVVARAILDGEPERVVAAPTGADFAGGERLAEYDGVSEGAHELDVALVDADGAVVVERRVRVDVVENIAMTVVLTRSCEGVMCPQSDPAAITCLGGLCVDPICSEVDPASCPSTCTRDSECMATAACTLGRCVEGACLSVPDDSMCAMGEVCLPTAGCVADPTIDGGVPDAGTDAGADADAGVFDCATCGDVPCIDGACDPVTGFDVYAHQCAVHASGRLSCWGRNEAGELGMGLIGDLAEPAQVPGITDAEAVITGGNHDTFSAATYRGHTCVLHADRTVSCWGNNAEGQLGIGTTTSAPMPMPVPGLTTVTQLSARGDVVCALLADSTVSCWGFNLTGQVGSGGFTRRTSPRQVELPGGGGPLTGVQEVRGGVVHVCARLTSGEVMCWGDNAIAGQVGNGSGSPERNPVIIGIPDAIDIGAGGAYTCAVRTGGAISCWGANTFGQLGNGVTGGDEALPVDVVSALTFESVVGSGTSHTCARDVSGAFHCWGLNNVGQLGDGTTRTRNVPVPVQGVSEIASMHPGFESTFAVTSLGTVLQLSDGAPAVVAF